jgi:signal transduction histidine kinase
MARAFAEGAGGALTITSRPGEGTTVTLWLPAAPDETAPTQES